MSGSFLPKAVIRQRLKAKTLKISSNKDLTQEERSKTVSSEFVDRLKTDPEFFWQQVRARNILIVDEDDDEVMPNDISTDFLELLKNCKNTLEGQRLITEELAKWGPEPLKKIEDQVIDVSIKTRSRNKGNVDLLLYGINPLQNFLNELLLDVDGKLPNKDLLREIAEWFDGRFSDPDKGWEEFSGA